MHSCSTTPTQASTTDEDKKLIMRFVKHNKITQITDNDEINEDDSDIPFFEQETRKRRPINVLQ